MSEKITDVRYDENYDEIYFEYNGKIYEIDKDGNLVIDPGYGRDESGYIYLPIEILKQIIELYENRKKGGE
jgi:hypothetical protein